MTSTDAFPAAVAGAPTTACEKPTIFFVGVTTARSSIMKVFPQWAGFLKLGDVRIQGIDCNLRDQAQVYRAVVQHIKDDPLARGALVTTHKIDLLQASRDLFDELDPYAQLMGEISSISKRGSRLIGHAKDPITSLLSVKSFLPRRHWETTGAELLVLGAGGASVALTSALLDQKLAPNRPTRIVVTDRQQHRLQEIHRIHEQLGARLPIEYHLTTRPEEGDILVATLRPGSLVVNATGLGKDAPGSPLTHTAIFPQRGFAWDFNYRGNLIFLEQARSQRAQRRLHVEDGWIYFLHGWTRVISEVFDVEIPTSGPVFDELSRLARDSR